MFEEIIIYITSTIYLCYTILYTKIRIAFVFLLAAIIAKLVSQSWSMCHIDQSFPSELHGLYIKRFITFQRHTRGGTSISGSHIENTVVTVSQSKSLSRKISVIVNCHIRSVAIAKKSTITAISNDRREEVFKFLNDSLVNTLIGCYWRDAAQQSILFFFFSSSFLAPTNGSNYLAELKAPFAFSRKPVRWSFSLLAFTWGRGWIISIQLQRVTMKCVTSCTVKIISWKFFDKDSGSCVYLSGKF